MTSSFSIQKIQAEKALVPVTEKYEEYKKLWPNNPSFLKECAHYTSYKYSPPADNEQDSTGNDSTKSFYQCQAFIKKFRVSEFDLKKFLREVSLATRAFHPCVAEFLGFNIQKDLAIISYKYYQNEDLATFLTNQGQNLDLFDRDMIIYGISRGLDYIHKVGIAHRNIHCNTVLIDENKRPFIGGFYYSKDTVDDNLSINPLTSCMKLAPPKIEQNYELSDDVYFAVDIFCHFFRGLVKNGQINLSYSYIPREYLNLFQWMADPVKSKRPKMGEVSKEIERYIVKTYKGDQLECFKQYKIRIDNDELDNLPKVRSKYLQSGDYIFEKIPERGDDLTIYYLDLIRIVEYNPEAAIIPAQIHLLGLCGFPKDFVKGCYFLIKSLNNQDSRAVTFRNLIYNSILSFESDYRQNHLDEPPLDINSIKEIVRFTHQLDQEKSQKIKSKEGLLMLGMIEEAKANHKSADQKNKYENALQLYLQSAENGCLPAMGRLACLFQYDHSLISDELAKQLLEKFVGISTDEKDDITEKVKEIIYKEKKIDQDDVNIGQFINIDDEKLICVFHYGLIQIFRQKYDVATLIFDLFPKSSQYYYDASRALFYIAVLEGQSNTRPSEILDKLLEKENQKDEYKIHLNDLFAIINVNS